MKKILVTLMLAGLCASPVISANYDLATTSQGAAAIVCGSIIGGAAIAGGFPLLRKGLGNVGSLIGTGLDKASEWYQVSSLKRGIKVIPYSVKAGACVGLLSSLAYLIPFAHCRYKNVPDRYLHDLGISFATMVGVCGVLGALALQP